MSADVTRAEMDEAHRTGNRFTVYGPRELRRGATVTDWPGAELGRITTVGTRPHAWTTRHRSTWGERYYCTMVDTAGNRWAGWVAAGMASNVRPIGGHR
jgi:hypothetical protein